LKRGTLADQEELQAICDTVGMGGDVHRWLADPRNIVLMEGDNAALFLWRWIGIYEAHVLFTKRGKLALDLGSFMLGMMFKSGAGMILSVVSDTLPQAGWFARQLGFRCRGEIETIEGLSKMYQMEAEQWAS
jgi:hypothetical protein